MREAAAEQADCPRGRSVWYGYKRPRSGRCRVGRAKVDVQGLAAPAWNTSFDVLGTLGGSSRPLKSLSGGIWMGDDLLATGHDKKVIYRLRVPKMGTVINASDASWAGRSSPA